MQLANLIKERHCRRRAPGIGGNILFGTGLLVVGIMLSSVAIDLPAYFDARNQLQTAVNAAALAGASQLPNGEAEANAAALEYGSENMVAGNYLQEDNFNFDFDGSTYLVSAQANVPTMVSRLMCAMKGSFSSGGDGLEASDGGSSEIGGGSDQDSSGAGTCDYVSVVAQAKAVPAARDVILVIDTSSSMTQLGNNRPFKDVKQAATAYVNQVIELDSESVDRIGIIQFDAAAKKAIAMKSTYESNNFNDVKTAINNMKIYSGGGWNTNYYSGLKMALDEMQASGRKNATKSVVFMTDGYPNLPDYSGARYTDCTSYYNSAEGYMTTYKKSKKASDYNKAQTQYKNAKTCATNYTNYMLSVTQEQANRAKDMEVTIHTIRIGGDMETSSSFMLIKDMLQNPSWDPMLLEYMAENTDGEQFAAANYDATAILDIYETIAKDVHMRLSS